MSAVHCRKRVVSLLVGFRNAHVSTVGIAELAVDATSCAADFAPKSYKLYRDPPGRSKPDVLESGQAVEKRTVPEGFAGQGHRVGAMEELHLDRFGLRVSALLLSYLPCVLTITVKLQ